MDFLSSSNIGNEGFDASFLQDFLQPAEDAFSEVQQCNLQLTNFQQAHCHQQQPQQLQQQQQHQQLLSLPDFPLALANSASPSLKPSSYQSLTTTSKVKRGVRKRKTEAMKVRSVTSPTSNWSSKAPDSLLDLSDDSEERDNPEELYAQGIIDAVELQRLKNRAAQRRFRHRQRAKMQSSTAQVKELTMQMNQMRLKQQELEARNGVLEYTCVLATKHLTELNEDPETYDLQQEMILRDTAKVWRRMNPTVSIKDLKEQKTGFYIAEVFPALLAWYRRLLEAGGTDPSSPQAKEISETVMLRRREENRVAAFSQWTIAMYVWNKEEMQKGIAYPSKAFWNQLLDALNLTLPQQLAFVSARQSLLNKLLSIRQQREKVIFALGLAMLQTAPTQRSGAEREDLQTGSTNEENNLRDNLEAEREAVMDFLFAIVDKTLTPVQEAQLDVACYPWCPDVWNLASILAAKHGDDTPDTIRSDANNAVVPAASLVPQHCTAEMLALPLLAHGYGLQLKRGLASIPLAQDFMAAQQKLKSVTIARLKDMTCWDVMRGRFLTSTLPSAPAVKGWSDVSE